MSRTIGEQLIKYLTDAHSIEEQALAQLRTAPRIADEPELAEIFSTHLRETERHEQLVRERLHALGAEPARFKDAMMAIGGKGFVLFARSQPDTPGKLATHAYSYEHLELASYVMLAHVALLAEDGATAALAREIAGEERRMAERLADAVDASAGASLDGSEARDAESTLPSYLADAYALESQADGLLHRAIEMTDDGRLRSAFEQHLSETQGHLHAVERRLDELGEGPSLIKNSAMRLGALNWAAFFGAQRDTPGKLTAFAYAFEHLEIAGYAHLRSVALRAGDSSSAELALRIAGEEQQAAERLAALFDHAAELSLRDVGVDVPVGSVR
jgi:ferritin-like metal-binding protein YciE